MFISQCTRCPSHMYTIELSVRIAKERICFDLSIGKRYYVRKKMILCGWLLLSYAPVENFPLIWRRHREPTKAFSPCLGLTCQTYTYDFGPPLSQQTRLNVVKRTKIPWVPTCLVQHSQIPCNSSNSSKALVYIIYNLYNIIFILYIFWCHILYIYIWISLFKIKN